MKEVNNKGVGLYSLIQSIMILFKLFEVGTAGDATWFIILIPTWIILFVLIILIFLGVLNVIDK